MTAFPAAYIDIWPADGGALHIASGESGVLSVSTAKDIWNTDSGSFQILLAPGGPYGPNASPQWKDIITPMSLCVIGMQRGVLGDPRSHIVMVGVVVNIQQDITWRFGDGVRRVTQIDGQDFSYFFSQSCSYSDSLLMYSNQRYADIGLLSHGIVQGSPDQIAQRFYNTVVAGNSGIMSTTTLQYDGSPVKLSSLLGSVFGKYPNTPVTIPTAWQFMALNGTWFNSFQALLPFPWYEVAVLTAETGQYGQAASGSTLSVGDNPQFPPVNPVLVARPLPLPTLINPQSPTLSTSLWDALPVAQPDNYGLSLLHFDEARSLAEARNFYVTNPLFLNSQMGVSNQAVTPWLYQYGAWIDVAGIQRYGYKARVDNIVWFADPSGQQAQSNASDSGAFSETVGVISLQPVAFHEPAPLMSSGTGVVNLRPDISPGTRFRCIPGKNGRQWDFYIRGVSHTFTFGEACMTTLTLCRGLPSDVYADHSLLQALHLGKGAIIDGEYQQSGATGIQVFDYKTSQLELGQLAPVFASPGQK